MLFLDSRLLGAERIGTVRLPPPEDVFGFGADGGRAVELAGGRPEGWTMPFDRVGETPLLPLPVRLVL